jgi:hypothetical protein
MSILGDRLRDATAWAQRQVLLDIAAEIDKLESDLFDALHAPQVSDPYQAGFEMGAAAAEKWKRDATVSRALLDEFMANPRDEYHTMAELYEYRMLYNAWAARYFADQGQAVKSWKHHDGEPCFDGYYFIVCLWTTEGLVTNHYKREDWDLFRVPEVETAPEWDGHTPAEAARRLRVMLEDTL